MTFVRPGGRIAVTGATGFVGQHLVRLLFEADYEVIGISERPPSSTASPEMMVDYCRADLVRGWPDVGSVDGIVHLAGLAAVGPSFGQPQEYINKNSAMVTNLFEHAVRSSWSGRAIVVSSGAVYDPSCAIGGLTEDARLLATSPYVVSKLLIERQVEYYRLRRVDAIVVRPFNHIGPGQRSGFIVPDLAEKLRNRAKESPILVGNLESARDYTDVSDIVEAYRLLLERPEPAYGTYNVCSGKAHSGWEVLEAICAALGTDVPPVEVSGQRAIDPPVIVGSSERLIRETGWTPRIDLRTSIDRFLSGNRPH